MKKLARFLTTIALSAPLLGGCSLSSIFSNFPEEDNANVDKLELRDHTTSVAVNTKYNFDGKVYIMYKDNTEKDITSKCTYSDVDTSKVGTADFRVDYETTTTIYYVTYKITVYDPTAKGELKSISVSNYTNTVEKGASYTFDGKVTANYSLDGVEQTIDINVNDCTITTLDTSSIGTKSLTISYTDTYNGKTSTKSATASIKVIQKPTSISASDMEINAGETKTISLTFAPSDTTEKGVTYTSSNESVATVDDDGLVTAKGSAGQSTTITITSKASPSVSKTINVTITELIQKGWTVLIYMCGADLESARRDGGQATADLQEIAKVAGQPDDVNIVVQAGGASSWKSTYSSVISADKCNRFHLKNKSYVKDSQTAKVNMGLASTLQDFVTWGVRAYPAENYGLILWNHGGAMDGCCFDEQYDNDGLEPSEVANAIRAARVTAGFDKLEFIGYDCCLMQVQDIASLNSEYAKYQIAAQESEWGVGWKYDNWVDNLFAKESTEEILTAIVDSFGEESEKLAIEYETTNDQTLSFIDLREWSTYQTAWEDMSSTLSTIVTGSSSWSTFASLLQTCQRFGLVAVDAFGYQQDYAYDIFDIGSFLTKIKSNNNYKGNSTLMSKVAAVESAYSDLIVHEFHGSGSSGATGLCLFAPVAGYSYKTSYSTTSTKLSTWRTICVNCGTWYSGYGY